MYAIRNILCLKVGKENCAKHTSLQILQPGVYKGIKAGIVIKYVRHGLRLFVETSANPYLKPHACSWIFEIQAVSRHCFVSSSFKIFWTKSGITSIWEVPKVYFLTCNMKFTMLNVCHGVQNFGRNESTCWLYYSKCFTFCQHLRSSQNLCFVNETWWGDSEHHVDARVRVFRLPTEAMFTYLLLAVFAKDSSVICSVTSCCVAGWALVGTGVCQETLYTCYKCT